jgi:hypothetical protein
LSNGLNTTVTNTNLTNTTKNNDFSYINSKKYTTANYTNAGNNFSNMNQSQQAKSFGPSSNNTYNLSSGYSANMPGGEFAVGGGVDTTKGYQTPASVLGYAGLISVNNDNNNTNNANLTAATQNTITHNPRWTPSVVPTNSHVTETYSYGGSKPLKHTYNTNA